MADEPWYFDDVVYDEHTTNYARHHLVDAAVSLGEAIALIETDIPVVVEDWSGKARWVFDEEMPGILEAGHQLVNLLTAAATAVEVAEEAARDEIELRGSLRAAYAEQELSAGRWLNVPVWSLGTGEWASGSDDG